MKVSGPRKCEWFERVLGDRSEGDPPVPIPNTEVKPLSPDGTARASVWERRKLPGLSHGPTERSGFCVFLWRGELASKDLQIFSRLSSRAMEWACNHHHPAATPV